MKTDKIKNLAMVGACSLVLGMTVQAQTPFYSVNGNGGTGGGTAGVSVTPSVSPAGSTALTDLGATTQSVLAAAWPSSLRAGRASVNGFYDMTVLACLLI